ncbi:cobalt-precorrin-6A reductase [Lacibacterium aquatile]|uniref:Cobalt-precorrin-6A reductase n=1 Tax=Lacibacterium aquatile TaxID=1168082 RepID=A0ABW5DVS0_9PROT
MRSGVPIKKILILGGTTEARALAALLASEPGIKATLSLAGRTANPLAQPVPVRTGGFGGIEGLADYLKAEAIDRLIDATHPYAARISANAVAAARRVGIPLLSLHRPGWQAEPGDRWIETPDGEAAVRSLGEAPLTVFVAFGRQEVEPLRLAPQHRYIVRSVDPVDLALPGARYILARGPFPEKEERALFEAEGVQAILCKNSGGAATYGKILAARALKIPVFMIARPDKHAGERVETIEAALDWCRHPVPPTLRGE